MATLYQRVMALANPSEIASIFDPSNFDFIPLSLKNPQYRHVDRYLTENQMTLMDLDVYQG